jgi:hypothetical protein
MRVKIVSDGTAHGTKVVDQATGAELEGVTSIEWGLTADQRKPAHVTLYLIGIPVELQGVIAETGLRYQAPDLLERLDI